MLLAFVAVPAVNPLTGCHVAVLALAVNTYPADPSGINDVTPGAL